MPATVFGVLVVIMLALASPAVGFSVTGFTDPSCAPESRQMTRVRSNGECFLGFKSTTGTKPDFYFSLKCHGSRGNFVRLRICRESSQCWSQCDSAVFKIGNCFKIPYFPETLLAMKVNASCLVDDGPLLTQDEIYYLLIGLCAGGFACCVLVGCVVFLARCIVPACRRCRARRDSSSSVDSHIGTAKELEWIHGKTKTPKTPKGGDSVGRLSADIDVAGVRKALESDEPTSEDVDLGGIPTETETETETDDPDENGDVDSPEAESPDSPPDSPPEGDSPEGEGEDEDENDAPHHVRPIAAAARHPHPHPHSHPHPHPLHPFVGYLPPPPLPPNIIAYIGVPVHLGLFPPPPPLGTSAAPVAGQQGLPVPLPVPVAVPGLPAMTHLPSLPSLPALHAHIQQHQQQQQLQLQQQLQQQLQLQQQHRGTASRSQPHQRSENE